MDELERGGELDHYHLLYATRADLLRRLRRRDEAAAAYRRALALAANPVERASSSGGWPSSSAPDPQAVRRRSFDGSGGVAGAQAHAHRRVPAVPESPAQRAAGARVSGSTLTRTRCVPAGPPRATSAGRSASDPERATDGERQASLQRP